MVSELDRDSDSFCAWRWRTLDPLNSELCLFPTSKTAKNGPLDIITGSRHCSVRRLFTRDKSVYRAQTDYVFGRLCPQVIAGPDACCLVSLVVVKTKTASAVKMLTDNKQKWTTELHVPASSAWVKLDQFLPYFECIQKSDH